MSRNEGKLVAQMRCQSQLTYELYFSGNDNFEKLLWTFVYTPMPMLPGCCVKLETHIKCVMAKPFNHCRTIHSFE